ncbi:MAG: hypothetical protein COA78_21410 [Blastopirellula sp.]|nr:MAG: hypothetical protein COA78_21410 [Blastopirellula sp.]
MSKSSKKKKTDQQTATVENRSAHYLPTADPPKKHPQLLYGAIGITVLWFAFLLAMVYSRSL